MDSAPQNLPPNPYERANCLSKLFFIWVLPFFRKSYHTILKLEDMCQPMSCDKSEILGDRLEANWDKQSNTPDRSLLSALFMTFWKEYAFLSTLSFFNDIIFRLGQPFLLGYLLQYFRSDSEINFQVALFYASGIVLLNALSAVFKNHIQYVSFHNGMKVRVAVCSLIYRKALRLSQTALNETSPGQVVNLLTNDVNRFHWASFVFDTLWIGPLLTIVACVLMCITAGLAGLAGILVVFAMVPILGCAGKLTSKYRLQSALRTDERVRLIHEIITSIQVVKMYAWERPFSRLISRAREIELKAVRNVLYIRSFHMTTPLFTTKMALFCSMLAIVLLYGPDQLNAKIFVISAYLGIVSRLMSTRFGRAVAEVAEVNVSLKRLEKFLKLEEKKTEFISCQQQNGLGKMNAEDGLVEIEIREPCSDVAILMRNFTARWKMPKRNEYVQSIEKHSKADVDHDQFNAIERETLSSVSVCFPKGKLIGVIGPVGAGKTSLLQAILRELPLESGSIHIDGSISYASQEAFVFSSSVRQNILFGLEYDRKRYNAVVHNCALENDFEQFKKGDQTIVGEHGASLSGGQKARINLARACYRDADIYLFDDPLSAVDTHVGAHIFEKCIGPNSRLAQRGATRILVTHQVHFLKAADWIIVLKDGKIDVQGSATELCTVGNDFTESVRMEETAAEFKRKGSETPPIQSQSSDISWSESKSKENKRVEAMHSEANSKGTIKGSILLHYFRAGANWFIVLILFLSFIFVQFLASFTDYFVAIWIKLEETRTDGSENFIRLSTFQCLSIQGTLIVVIFVLGLISAIGFFSVCLRISRNIHRSMFRSIISTKIRFFETNPSGRILNRFSKDIGSIDGYLPKSLFGSMQNTLNLIGSALVIAVVNPIFLIPVLILSIFFIMFRRIYLETVRNAKRLESNTKSPSFTHFTATLSGLSTVRAYKVEDTLRNQFDNHQDAHSACWFIYMSALSAFSFFIDVLCVIFISCVIFYYMIFDTGASGAQIGLVITQAIKITGLVAMSIQQSASVSRQMTTVERLLEYGNLKREKQPKKPIALDSNWPSEGCIAFRYVFYRYFADADPVLRGLSFVIKPKEKIGIVGRTGAGKSSLIGALFRLANVDGEISIDGIDTASIRLRELRKRISIIPQDPVLYSGTLRKNLDPFEEYSDAEIWNALDCVEMKDLAADPLGLESRVLPRGSNFSHGTRQLLCLARAILRKNRILVLDEATANVDPKTDALIQQTIRKKFTKCTVLTVAHRLHNIIDSDRIMVIDSGVTVEFDEPHNLLQNECGIFYRMIQSLGENEFDRLSKIAMERSNDGQSRL